MNRTMRPALELAMGMMLLSGCVLAPPFYWAEPIRGRVIDADTQRPIEGAVVVADWKLYGGGIGHGGHRDSLLIEETLTDSNGEFSFGKWGPKMRPAWEILDKAPNLVVFKAGYDYANLWNGVDSNWPRRQSDWDRKDVQLKRSTRSPERRLMSLSDLMMFEPPQRLVLEEILREEPLHRPWPGHGPALFDRVRELLSKAKENPS